MGYKNGKPIDDKNPLELYPKGWFPNTEFVLEHIGDESVRFAGGPSPKWRPTLLIQKFGQDDTTEELIWRVRYSTEWAPCCEIVVVVTMTTKELQAAFSEVPGSYSRDGVFQRWDDCLSFPTHQLGVNILLTAEICEAVMQLLAQNAQLPSVEGGQL